jgi:NADH-ubiquinone oxidoreductase chain 5
LPYLRFFTLVILGGWIGYGMAGFAFSDLFSVNWYSSLFFYGSMWFIPLLSTYGVSFWPLEVGYRTVKVFDFGWIEYFGGQGIYCASYNLSRVKWFQFNGLRIFKCFMLCELLFCCLFLLIT